MSVDVEQIALDPSEIEASRNKYLWKEMNVIQRMHQELASLYSTKSQDSKRIALLWRAIEEREALLALDGVDINA